LGNTSLTIWFLKTLASSSQVESVENTAANTIEHLVVSFHLTDIHWLLIFPSVSLVLLFESLDFFEQIFILPLNGLLLGNCIFFGRKQEALLLVPLGSVGLVSENHLSLFRLNLLRFLLQVRILLLKQFLFSVELLFHLINLFVSFVLDEFEIFRQSISLFNQSFKLLFKSTLLSNHTLGADFKLLIELLVISLKSVDNLLVFITLIVHVLIDFVEFFLVFGLKLCND